MGLEIRIWDWGLGIEDQGFGIAIGDLGIRISIGDCNWGTDLIIGIRIGDLHRD